MPCAVTALPVGPDGPRSICLVSARVDADECAAELVADPDALPVDGEPPPRSLRPAPPAGSPDGEAGAVQRPSQPEAAGNLSGARRCRAENRRSGRSMSLAGRSRARKQTPPSISSSTSSRVALESSTWPPWATAPMRAARCTPRPTYRSSPTRVLPCAVPCEPARRLHRAIRGLQAPAEPRHRRPTPRSRGRKQRARPRRSFTVLGRPILVTRIRLNRAGGQPGFG
jgi:hypothetical protein